MLLKIVLCPLKTLFRVLGIRFVRCSCFCHTNYKAGVKTMTAGRILTWQTPGSGLLLWPLCPPSVNLTWVCWLHMLPKDWKEKWSDMGNVLCWNVWKRHSLHAQLFIQSRMTNNGLTCLTICNPTRWTSYSYWSVSGAQWKDAILCCTTRACCRWHTLV